MKTRIMNRTGLVVAVAVACIGSAGCATDDDYWETKDFGEAVRYTVDLQTDHSGAAGAGLDGAKAVAILEAYRQEAALPRDVGFTDGQTVRDVVFQVED